MTNATPDTGHATCTIIDDDGGMFVNSHLVTFTDVDGDLVSVKSSKGGFTSDLSKIFSFGQISDGRYQLQGLTLGSAFQGTDLTFSASPVQSAGDSHVNVGFINAAGVDLGKITLPGDLGKLSAGETIAKGGLAGLYIDSLGKRGLTTGATDLVSVINGPVGILKVLGDVDQATFKVQGVTSNSSAGDIGSLNIGGAIIGGADSATGQIYFTGTLKDAVIGSIQGGAGIGSGTVNGDSNMLGNLGRITVNGSVTGGSGANSGEILANALGAATIKGGLVGGSGQSSGVLASDGDLGKVQILSDLKGDTGINSGLITSSGSIKSVTVGGSMLGGAGASSGSIVSAYGIGAIKIAGDLKGDAGSSSGDIISGDTLNSLTIYGSVLGSTGNFSGSILSSTNINSIKISHEVHGGDGFSSGAISANGKLASLSIGTGLTGGAGNSSGSVFSGADPGLPGDMGNVKIGQDVQGGVGANSGQINSWGNLSSLSIGGALKGADGFASGSIVTFGAMGTIRVKSDVQGGLGTESGQINSGFKLGAVSIGGSLLGGAGTGSGSVLTHALFGAESDLQGKMGPVSIGGDLAGGSGNESGQIDAAGDLASVYVGGSVISGTNAGGGILNKSGSIRAEDSIGAVTVKGGLEGNESNPVIISARGQTVHGATTDLALKSLTVGTTVEYAQILAGYDTDLNPQNPDAQIGAIKVQNHSVNGFTAAYAWRASSIAAGVADAGNDGFGAIHNALISGDQTPRIVSKIASILIAGDIAGTGVAGEHFGFVAQQIGSFKFNSTALKLNSSGVPDVVDPIGSTTDTSLREIA